MQIYTRFMLLRYRIRVFLFNFLFHDEYDTYCMMQDELIEQMHKGAIK